MTLELQFAIKNQPQFQNYLREHSYWYKYLNRNPALFQQFQEEVKEVYRLRPSDKVNQLLNTLEVLQTLMSTLH